MMRTGIVRSECWKNENINVRLIWPKRDMLKSLHRVQLLTVTPKYPAKRRAPMMMSREPIKKRTVAKAMALYGTFGGLFLNCRGEIWWNYERNAHLLTIRVTVTSMHAQPTTELIEQSSIQRRASDYSTEAELDTFRDFDYVLENLITIIIEWIKSAFHLLQVTKAKRSNMLSRLLPVNRCIRHHLLLTWSI